MAKGIGVSQDLHQAIRNAVFNWEENKLAEDKSIQDLPHHQELELKTTLIYNPTNSTDDIFTDAWVIRVELKD